MTPPRAHISVDIGGTFTDVIGVAGGVVQSTKVLSTPDDLSRGVLEGIEIVLADLGAEPAQMAPIVHATTAATNALLERKGGRVGLLVTEGFGDILELARQRRPDPYDLTAAKLTPLVARSRVVEIPERMQADGEVLIELDEDAVRAAWAQLEEAAVEAIAVCFLHSYANPEHEQRAAALLRELAGPGVPVFASHEVLAEPREYERTSTTVIAAYLSRVTSGYQRTLAERLGALGAPDRFWVMKSSGGLVASDHAAAHPEELVESGPAAGVIAASRAGRRLGLEDLISFDMGGTTAKASLVLGGAPRLTWDYEVGGTAHAGDFLSRGSGHPLRVPVIDLAEVGTGGGSIAWVDEAGALRVGPQSAGADPGPACYGRGGTLPTVTDAVAVLGYLDVAGRSAQLGRLRVDAAREAIERHVAGPLGMDVLEAAGGIFDLANAQMAGAVRLVSMAKGYDPRSFALLAFGGAGPVHAWAVATELGVARVVVPSFAGLNSAVGLLQADFRVDLSQAYRVVLDGGERAAGVVALLRELSDQAVGELAAQGHALDAVTVGFAADMRYRGQSYDVPVQFPGEIEDLDALGRAFDEAHERAYGHAHPNELSEITVLRVSARVLGDDVAIRRPPATASTEPVVREVRFGGEAHQAPVLSRAAIGERPQAGPLIVEADDTSIVVPPGASVTADAEGFLSIALQGAQNVG